MYVTMGITNIYNKHNEHNEGLIMKISLVSYASPYLLGNGFAAVIL